MSEYLTDLGIKNYKILQNTDGCAFSQDSVFLANTAKFRGTDKVLDLGTGSGIIATLALVKKGAQSAVGIELQPDIADMAKRSATLNGLQDRFEIICGDVRDIRDMITAESFDKVLCNPPYFAKERPNGLEASARNVTRTESCATLSDFVKAAAYALKFGSDAYFIIKIARLSELMCVMSSNRLEPKKITLIYPKLSLGVDTVIVQAKKGGKAGLVSDTLIVMSEDGNYTQRYKELYE